MTGRRALAAVAAATLACLTLTSCNLDPRTTTLPGGTGTGGDGFTVTAVFSSTDNLVPNSEVQFNDVRIGTVRRIELDHKTWRATVKFSVEKDVPIPANVHAAVGQKSLLGAEYIQLSSPTNGAVGRLRKNAVIPLSQTNHYPGTEEVLSAVSLLLNNGGLSQLRTITTELNKALSGREQIARDVLSQLATFATRLNNQKAKLIDATEALNRLSGQLAANRDTIARALTHITPAVATLNRDRTRLTGALVALKHLGVVASKVLDENRAGLATNLALLKPTLTKLATAGKAIPDSLPLLVSFPFPITTLFKAIKGDYMNLFETLDISLGSIQRDYLGSVVPTAGSGGGSGGLPIPPLPLSTIQQAKNPLTAPLGQSGSTSATTEKPRPSKNPWPVGSTSPSPAPSPSPSGSCTLVGALMGKC
jgi:phospholipid/cholesterol/gamma-HCH transport system substrate-binding protein